MSIRKKNKSGSQDTAVNKDTTVSSEHEKLSKRYSKIQEADYFPYVPPSQTVTQSDLENLFAPPISLGIPKEEPTHPTDPTEGICLMILPLSFPQPRIASCVGGIWVW